MTTLKTIRTLPETAALSARWASIAAHSVVEAYQAKPDEMVASDAKMVSHLLMAIGLLAKVELLSLVLMHKQAAALASEANDNFRKGKFREAEKLIGDIGKLAAHSSLTRDKLKESIRTSKELTNAAHRVSRSIEVLSEGMRSQFQKEIEKIKKAQEEKLRQVKK
ncbi:hypothetical protein HY638_03355 [Candidatus Woesearchaeota archaeon]|nr:hypothetical protein [Candidatus Woesearchaeota archaeon]